MLPYTVFGALGIRSCLHFVSVVTTATETFKQPLKPMKKTPETPETVNALQLFFGGLGATFFQCSPLSKPFGKHKIIKQKPAPQVAQLKQRQTLVLFFW